IVDYGDADALAEAAVDCQVAVHLVGVIRESKATSYTQAHEDTCRALTFAARTAGIGHIIYLSIFGADPASPNTCLASKGRAEDLLRESAIRTTILRIPMVLGPGDPSTQGLVRQARARLVPLARGGATLQQPIDTRDVVAAIIAATRQAACGDVTLDLGGPESLSHAALIERTARILGTQPSFFRVPLAPARLLIRTLDSLLSESPITLAMFDVLQHDDDIDPEKACARLGIQLLPLDETLRYCVAEEGSTA
ncbi:MAG: NAD(P)H-binding protein, partial [Myxococcota bacterium]